VTDPSSLTVFAGLSQGRVQTISTTGIELTAFSLVPSSTPASGFGDWTVAQALPALSGRQVSSAQRFTWSKWEVVKVEPYLKKAYTTLQPLFAEQAVSQPLQASQSRTTSGVR
jgi:hypothetical protein